MRASVHWGRFVWDEAKDKHNVLHHGLDFKTAAKAFLDPQRVIVKDEAHSMSEARWFCIGQIDSEIVTVRYTFRGRMVRIIGAGHWRKGRRLYEALKKERSHP
jgi:uncharacterized DUF497 family protein